MKGAYGTMVMLCVMNLVYVIRALIKKDLNLWLEFSVTEFAFKNTGFFKGYDGSLPFWAALVIAIVFWGALLFLSIRAPKNSVMLIPLTVLYVFDTALMTFTLATNHFGDFSESSWINVAAHAIMLLLLGSGLYAAKQVKKPNIEKEEN